VSSFQGNLNPRSGILHADSASWLRPYGHTSPDPKEAQQPRVGAFVPKMHPLKTILTRDFFETRQGACRVLPPPMHRLAEMAPKLARAVAPVAESIAHQHLRSQNGSARKTASIPTLLTQANYIAGLAVTNRKRSNARTSAELDLPRPDVTAALC
jgi:hypothetical protein